MEIEIRGVNKRKGEIIQFHNYVLANEKKMRVFKSLFRVCVSERWRKRVRRRMCASVCVGERKKMRMENVCERGNECLFVCEYERERESKSKRHIMKERRSACERGRRGPCV